MTVQHFPRGTASDKFKNRSDFEAFVALVLKAPSVEGVKVRLAWAAGKRAAALKSAEEEFRKSWSRGKQ